MDLIAKTSHLPGIQLGYLTTLFGLALARPRCTLISGKWSQWCSVATARAATGDFLSVTEQHKHSPLQVQQDYRLLLLSKSLTGRFIKFWNMSQSILRFLIGSLALTHHYVWPTHQEREREKDGPEGPQILHWLPTFWTLRSFKYVRHGSCSMATNKGRYKAGIISRY